MGLIQFITRQLPRAIRRGTRFGIVLVLLTACASLTPPQAAPVATVGSLPDTNAQEQRDPELPWPLLAPAGFQLRLYARDLGEIRSVTFSPGGIPYVTIMNRKERNAGLVLALPDDNGDGRSDRTITIAEGLDRPHGIVFYNGLLYVGTPDAIWLLRDADGDLVAETRELIAKVPGVGDHWARPILFDGAGNLLVAIGSTCNMCQEKDEQRATILRFPSGGAPTTNPQGEILAHGLRSIVDIKIRPGTEELWGVNNGPDHLGRDIPPDQLFLIEAGKHYGWPYCIGDREPDLQALDHPDIVIPDGSPREIFCRDRVSPPAMVLPPHSAPLGLTFYEGDQFPAEMHGDMFIAMHGSYSFANTNGYKVVRVPMNDGKPGLPQEFITGWTPPGATKWLGRPVDVEIAPDGSMYITDDFNGFLYRVTWNGN